MKINANHFDYSHNNEILVKPGKIRLKLIYQVQFCNYKTHLATNHKLHRTNLCIMLYEHSASMRMANVLLCFWF